MAVENKNFEDLLFTIRKLRAPEGCLWDRKQTAKTLMKYLREEVDELFSAIENNDTKNICEETGDVLYILIMISEIYSESETFALADVISEINTKLIRRHPHVFQGKKAGNEEELRLQWESIKKSEKKKK